MKSLLLLLLVGLLAFAFFGREPAPELRQAEPEPPPVQVPIPIPAPAPALPVQARLSELVDPYFAATFAPIDKGHGELQTGALHRLRAYLATTREPGGVQAAKVCDLLLAAADVRAKSVARIETSESSQRTFFNQLATADWNKYQQAAQPAIRTAYENLCRTQDSAPTAQRGIALEAPTFGLLDEKPERPPEDRHRTTGPGRAIIYNPYTGAVVGGRR